jgi:hypothetical protein
MRQFRERGGSSKQELKMGETKTSDNGGESNVETTATPKLPDIL